MSARLPSHASLFGCSLIRVSWLESRAINNLKIKTANPILENEMDAALPSQTVQERKAESG
jgi:hypothetical protein